MVPINKPSLRTLKNTDERIAAFDADIVNTAKRHPGSTNEFDKTARFLIVGTMTRQCRMQTVNIVTWHSHDIVSELVSLVPPVVPTAPQPIMPRPQPAKPVATQPRLTLTDRQNVPSSTVTEQLRER